MCLGNVHSQNRLKADENNSANFQCWSLEQSVVITSEITHGVHTSCPEPSSIMTCYILEKCFPLHCSMQVLKMCTTIHKVLRGQIWGTILTWVNYSVCGCENCLQWLMVSLNIFHVSGKNSYSVLSLLVYLLWVELAEILLCAHVFVHADH